jgi:hypothetical protein
LKTISENIGSHLGIARRATSSRTKLPHTAEDDLLEIIMRLGQSSERPLKLCRVVQLAAKGAMPSLAARPNKLVKFCAGSASFAHDKRSKKKTDRLFALLPLPKSITIGSSVLLICVCFR